MAGRVAGKVVLLTGGVAAAITGEGFAVFWAGVMALLLIADAEIYRRLDARDAPLAEREVAALSAWAFLHSAFYSSLPVALWTDGEPAGAAAAMALWVAGVVRQFGATGRILPVALAGAAPPALSLLIAPLAIAAAAEFRARLVAQADDFLARFGSDIEPRLAQRTRPPWQDCSAAQTVKAIGGLVRELRTFACVEFVVAARLGFYFAALARRRIQRHLGAEGDALYAPLLSGLPGSLVTEQTLCLERVARSELTLQAFLDQYGHAARNELEIAEPRLDEAPAMLDSMLHDLRLSGRSPRDDFTHKLAQRLDAEATLELRLQQAGVPLAAIRELQQDLAIARAFLPLRETIKHHYTARYAEIRRGLLRLERQLGWDDGLIFHLYPEELARTLNQPAAMLQRAQSRCNDWQLAAKAVRQQSLPDVIFASNLAAIGRACRQGSHERLLQGAPLSPGRVRGVARIVDPAAIGGEEFGSQDILVLRSANLGIAPLLRVVAGMVVEVGGLLAHGACQAREAGIPAVVLADATHLLKDGAILCLDGSLGTVEIVPAEQQKTGHERCYETV